MTCIPRCPYCNSELREHLTGHLTGHVPLAFGEREFEATCPVCKEKVYFKPQYEVVLTLVGFEPTREIILFDRIESDEGDVTISTLRLLEAKEDRWITIINGSALIKTTEVYTSELSAQLGHTSVCRAVRNETRSKQP